MIDNDVKFVIVIALNICYNHLFYNRLISIKMKMNESHKKCFF